MVGSVQHLFWIFGSLFWTLLVLVEGLWMTPWWVSISMSVCVWSKAKKWVKEAKETKLEHKENKTKREKQRNQTKNKTTKNFSSASFPSPWNLLFFLPIGHAFLSLCRRACRWQSTRNHYPALPDVAATAIFPWSPPPPTPASALYFTPLCWFRAGCCHPLLAPTTASGHRPPTSSTFPLECLITIVEGINLMPHWYI